MVLFEFRVELGRLPFALKICVQPERTVVKALR
jgi:hypothetical protein